MARFYRVVVAESEPALVAAAGNWTILATTIRSYAGLDTAVSAQKVAVGAVVDNSSGMIALAFKDA